MTCPFCGGVGWYKLAVPFDHPQFGVLQRCECMQGVLSQRDVREMQRLHAEIGERYREATFDRYAVKRRYQPYEANGVVVSAADQVAIAHDALQTCRAYAANLGSTWLYLYGSPGSGKTHLAIAILLDVAHSKRQFGSFVSAASFLEMQRPNVLSDDARATLWQQYTTTPLLVVDDMIDTLMRSPWAQERMYMLLNARYNAHLPTVITANVHFDEMSEPRISSRISESLVIYMPLSDYRRTARKVSV